MQDLFYSSRSTSKRLPKVWCNRSVLHVLRHECMHRRFDLLKACAEHACEHNMRDLECFTHLMLFELHGLWLHDTSLLHAHCSSAEVLVVTIDPLQPWTAKPTKWRRSRRAPNLSTALHVSPPPPPRKTFAGGGRRWRIRRGDLSRHVWGRGRIRRGPGNVYI